MESFNLSIFSPERKLTEKEKATSLLITTVEGECEILPGHVNMVSKIETGKFQYQPEKGPAVVGVISSGFINVEGNDVKVLAETLELAKEIKVGRAKDAQMKAEQMLSDASLDEHQFKKYQLKLQRAIIRQEIAGGHSDSRF